MHSQVGAWERGLGLSQLCIRDMHSQAGVWERGLSWSLGTRSKYTLASSSNTPYSQTPIHPCSQAPAWEYILPFSGGVLDIHSQARAWERSNKLRLSSKIILLFSGSTTGKVN